MSVEHDDLFMDAGHDGLEHVTVRELREDDLASVVKIDERITGRSRGEYLKMKLSEATRDTGIRISLAAETDDIFAGFVIGRLYYGEFGVPEPVAIIDTIGVHPEFRGKKIGTALFDQLERNMRAMGIENIQTQVDWDQQELIGFLARMGFSPAPVLSLQKRLAE